MGRSVLFSVSVCAALLCACGGKAGNTPGSGSAVATGSVAPLSATTTGGPLACSTAGPACPADASCVETPLGGRCECRPGFAGNGARCTQVAAALHGARWDMPCKAPSGGKDVCQPKDPKPTATVTLAGNPELTYLVTLRFRGVVEQQSYAGGTAEGFFQIGGRSDNGSYNVYELRVSQPTQSFFLNAGKAGIRNCFALDYTRTLGARGGAELTLLADAQDGALITAFGADRQPVAVPDVKPADNDGQFIQMDVLDVSAGQDARIRLDAAVLFAPDDATLKPAAVEALGPALDAARREADAQLVIEGHTDSTGDAAHNQELSVRRARAVAERLVADGVAAERLLVRGLGASQPIAPNDTKEGRDRNRRVEIVVRRP